MALHHQPEWVPYVSFLRACAKQKDLETGTRLHADILAKKLLGEHAHVRSALVSMYAKCGDLEMAYAVFEELPLQDAMAWNALIAGFSQQGHGGEALECFEKMLCRGVLPDEVTFACAFKACGHSRALARGKQIHHMVVVRGFLHQKHAVLGNALVDMYAKCGALDKAQEVFDELRIRDVVCWSSLIAGYAQKEMDSKPLSCFERMQTEGIAPDSITFTFVLKACGKMGAFSTGRQIHSEILSTASWTNDLALSTSLVDMYAKCGEIREAQEAFDCLPVRCVAAWNALIAGYAYRGKCEEALDCFQKMQSYDSLSPNTITFTGILKACRTVEHVRRIHGEIVGRGFLGQRVMLGNVLVDVYIKCGAIAEAHRVHDALPSRDVVSWNSLIAGYAEDGQGSEALSCFHRMQKEGLSPNIITFVWLLKACSSIEAMTEGEKIHCQIMNARLLEDKDPRLATTLLDMYAKCGNLERAQQVLDSLHVQDVISWNALIVGYNKQGKGEDALRCFDRMLNDCILPSETTLSCMLKACGNAGAVGKGKRFHKEIVDKELFHKHAILRNALVGMYAKCGALQKAEDVFNHILIRDVASWNALIAGYSRWGRLEGALNSFVRLQSDGFSPNRITFFCIIKACSSGAVLGKGKQFHELIINKGFLERHPMLGNALVDMYAKCGVLDKAQEVLDELPFRDVVTWSALIAGYARRGQVKEALDCFERMQSEGLSPDAVTFLCVLSACSRSGLVNEGEMYFENMRRGYGVMPQIQHYTCMIDLFSQTGHFGKALEVMKGMPSYYPMWCSLLGTSKKWGNVLIGGWAFEKAVLPDSTDATAYACLASINAAANPEGDATKSKAMREGKLSKGNRLD